MSLYHYKILSDLGQLKELSGSWNELWERSKSRVANLRSEVVELIVQHFFGPQEFRALVVFQEQRLVAALPLRIRNNLILGKAGQSIGNPHAPMAGLLLDPASSGYPFETVFREGLSDLGLQLLQLDWFHLEDQGSRWLAQVAKNHGLAYWVRRPEQVVMLEVPGLTETSPQSSANHRKKLRRWLRDLSSMGAVTLEEVTSDCPGRIAEGMEEALDVELNSWKGATGSAIKSNPIELAYWRKWEEALSAAGLFRLYLLRLSGKAIAFDLGYVGQRVYSSVKISHLENFANYGVGHVRDWLLMERLQQEQQVDWIDTVAPGTAGKWKGCQYPVGKIMMSTGGWIGGAQVNLFGTLQRLRANTPTT